MALGVNDELGGSVNSGLGSLSLWNRLDYIIKTGCALMNTYERDSASGSLGVLAVEQETLSGLTSPGDDIVGDVGSLVSLEVGELVLGGSLGAEPEMVLGVDEVAWMG